MFYGWVVVGVAVIAVLMTAGSRAAPGALLVDMERSTGWSTSTLSIAASISLVDVQVGGPLAAFVMSRIGLRSTTVMSLLLAAVSFLFSARTESLWSFYLWFGFGAGLASGLIASVLGATIANRWFVDRRGLHRHFWCVDECWVIGVLSVLYCVGGELGLASVTRNRRCTACSHGNSSGLVDA